MRIVCPLGAVKLLAPVLGCSAVFLWFTSPPPPLSLQKENGYHPYPLDHVRKISYQLIKSVKCKSGHPKLYKIPPLLHLTTHTLLHPTTPTLLHPTTRTIPTPPIPPHRSTSSSLTPSKDKLSNASTTTSLFLCQPTPRLGRQL